MHVINHFHTQGVSKISSRNVKAGWCNKQISYKNISGEMPRWDGTKYYWEWQVKALEWI